MTEKIENAAGVMANGLWRLGLVLLHLSLAAGAEFGGFGGIRSAFSILPLRLLPLRFLPMRFCRGQKSMIRVSHSDKLHRSGGSECMPPDLPPPTLAIARPVPNHINASAPNPPDKLPRTSCNECIVAMAAARARRFCDSRQVFVPMPSFVAAGASRWHRSDIPANTTCNRCNLLPQPNAKNAPRQLSHRSDTPANTKHNRHNPHCEYMPLLLYYLHFHLHLHRAAAR